MSYLIKFEGVRRNYGTGKTVYLSKTNQLTNNFKNIKLFKTYEEAKYFEDNEELGYVTEKELENLELTDTKIIKISEYEKSDKIKI